MPDDETLPGKKWFPTGPLFRPAAAGQSRPPPCHYTRNEPPALRALHPYRAGFRHTGRIFYYKGPVCITNSRLKLILETFSETPRPGLLMLIF